MRTLALLFGLLPSAVLAQTCSAVREVPDPLIILFAGQSNAHFAQGSGVYSTTGRVTINRDYLVQNDFFIPSVGDSIAHSSAAVKLGDLLSAYFDIDVRLIMTSIGATTSAQWAGGSQSYWTRVSTSAKAFNPHLILWVQGEGDTALSVSQSTYFTNLSSAIASVVNSGVSTPWFIAINSSGLAPADIYSGYPNVRNAQYQVINAGLARLGPDLDVIRRTASNVDTDKVHFINQGFVVHADKWFRTIKTYYGY